MTQDFDFEKYSPDVQAHFLQQMNDAMLPMYKGERYVNCGGNEYLVLEDSPAGNVYVHVKQQFKNGTADRWVSKAVLCA